MSPHNNERGDPYCLSYHVRQVTENKSRTTKNSFSETREGESQNSIKAVQNEKEAISPEDITSNKDHYTFLSLPCMPSTTHQPRNNGLGVELVQPVSHAPASSQLDKKVAASCLQALL